MDAVELEEIIGMERKIEIDRWSVIQEIISYTGQSEEDLGGYKMYDLLWKRNLLRGGHAA